MSDLSPSSSAERASSAAVERLSVEPVPDRPRRPPLKAVPAVEPPSELPEPAAILFDPRPIHAEIQRLYALINQRRARIPELLQASFTAIARVLAVRLQLLLSLIGAFVLAMGAMRSGELVGLAVVVAFAFLTVLPLVWLEYSGRPK